MTPELPAIGTVEDDRLEFKSAQAICGSDLAGIGREVVAFLNSTAKSTTHGPAWIWIGVTEHGEKLTGYEPVPEPLTAKRRVEDHCCDTIEPKPNHEEVRVESVALPSGGTLLAIRILGAEHRAPYALALPRGGRAFLARSGPRVRPMDRDEIATAFRVAAAHAPNSGRDKNAATFRRLLEPFRVRTARRFVLAIAPDVELRLEPQKLRDLLDDPTRSGNRTRAFTVFTEQVPSLVTKDRIETHRDGERSLRVDADGAIVFEARLEYLLTEYRGRKLEPTAVLEIPTSFVRFAREVYRTVEIEADLPFRFAARFLGVSGVTLPPYSPRSLAAMFHEEERVAASDIVIDQVWTWSELSATDDRLAYRVIKIFYAEFDFGEREIPAEFDAKAGLLRLPR